MPRKLASWVDTFFDYTALTPSPPLFRKWAAIAAIAGALERKVWVDIGMGPLYPNLYTFLVAPPGVGKTVLTGEVWNFWSSLIKGDNSGHYVAEPSLTHASLIDELADAKRKVVRPQDVSDPIKDFNALKICSNELSTFLPAYENDFIGKMTDLYDGKPFGERRRGTGVKLRIEAPNINLIAATTPSYLMNVLPEGAWDQGFLARTILIYSGSSRPYDIFQNNPLNIEMQKDLVNDIAFIGDLYGQMFFDEDAVSAFRAWHLEGGPPKPDHPKLQHYATRRTSHLLKLCMVASAAEGGSLTVTLEHYQQALSWLLEAEAMMKEVFKEASISADSRAIEECWYFVYTHWMKYAMPMEAYHVVKFLQERLPSHSVPRVLENMENSRVLTKMISDEGGTAYRPMVKAKAQ